MNANGTSDVAVATINVLPLGTIPDVPPSAVDDSALTRSDTPVTINVLSNDTDSDSSLDPTSVTIVSAPSSGTTLVNADGTITYTPGTLLGYNTFSYTVKDDLGLVSNVATVTVFVNAPPIAVNDSAFTRSDTPVTISVLSNDSDIDGTLDPGSVTVVADPSSGSAVVNADGDHHLYAGDGTWKCCFHLHRRRQSRCRFQCRHRHGLCQRSTDCRERFGPHSGLTGQSPSMC